MAIPKLLSRLKRVVHLPFERPEFEVDQLV
jgi:hypothetical protein